MATKFLWQGKLDVTPVSVNQAYSNAKKGRILSQKGREFETLCLWELQKYKKQILYLRSIFDKTKYVFRVSYVFCLPNMLTKTQVMSETGGDVDNYVKLTTDSIFNQLRVNDAHVHIVKSMKIKYHEAAIIFRIRLMDKEDMPIKERLESYLDFLEESL